MYVKSGDLAQIHAATSARPGTLFVVETVTWTDIGSFVTAIVTVLVLAAAAIFAGRQVREARRFREAQFRPFVILDFSYFNMFAELTITNIGTTLARDVTFDFDPPLKTALDDDPKYGHVLADSYMFREGIPSLPPGKLITIVFDKEPERSKAGLPDRYDVVVTYRDPFGHEYDRDPPIVLDLGVYRDRGPIHRYGLHETYQLLEKRLPKV